jgi:hypothetical protein
MFADRRSRLLLVIGTAAVLGGCGTTTTDSGVPDSKIIAALDMKKIQGHYAIDDNPFCSTSKLLNDADEVKRASSSHRVIASRDATVGIEIIKPFAPSCGAKAQRKLNRLAGLKRHHHRKRGAHHQAKGKRNSKKGGGNGG